jgi:hypothetical protein
VCVFSSRGSLVPTCTALLLGFWLNGEKGRKDGKVLLLKCQQMRNSQSLKVFVSVDLLFPPSLPPFSIIYLNLFMKEHPVRKYY